MYNFVPRPDFSQLQMDYITATCHVAVILICEKLGLGTRAVGVHVVPFSSEVFMHIDNMHVGSDLLA